MSSPIPLPDLPWKECSFDPISPSDVSMMEGRRTELAGFGTPYWVASFRTNFLTPTQYGIIDAFTMKVSSRGTQCLAHDVFRPRPIAYDNGRPLSGVKASGGAFNGDADVSSITDSRHIVVSGLPAGFTLIKGDYVEVRQSERVRSLHRIVEDAVASAAGVVTLSILFDLDLQHFTAAATAHFEKPSTLMAIDPGSLSAPKSWGNREAFFSATEVFFS
ncbi:hypothetical protein [Sinorhizobium medicae]|nr:hypothetical protein [Sinorhizobium medicae]